MRTITAVLGCLALAATTAAAQVDPDTLDLTKIYNAADSMGGLPVVDTLPEIINCPPYDPANIRGDASTFSFQRQAEQESRMGMVEFTLEFVVGKDGRAERGRTKVIRSNNSTLESTFQYWIPTCAFKPGKIGEHTVRVRMEREWRYHLNR